jgi:hypothetical protein
MMSNIKKLYKQFFGYKLTEAMDSAPVDPKTIAATNSGVKELTTNVNALKAAFVSENEIDEAQLVNNLTDYRGGIEYVVRDPQTAQSVLDEIEDVVWSVDAKDYSLIFISTSLWLYISTVP